MLERIGFHPESASSPAQEASALNERVSERAMSKARSWMQEVATKRFAIHLGMIMHVGTSLGDVLIENGLGGKDARPAHARLADPGHAHEHVSAAELRIDERLAEHGIRPEEVRELLEGVLGQETAIRNIRAVIYSPVEIPMPAHYRGTARFESGHCTRSTQVGARSDVVLTPSTFHGMSPSGIVKIILHEAIGHAVDYQNDDQIPLALSRKITRQLHAIVAGHRATIFDYANEYQGGSLTPEREDRVQAEETFALLMEDAFTLPPLAATDPLRRLPLIQQMTRRLAQQHAITEAVAAPYAHVLATVAEVRGQAFFEHGQEVVARVTARLVERRQVETDRLRQEQVRATQEAQRVRLATLGNLAIPGASELFQAWSTHPVDQATQRVHQDIMYLEGLSDQAFQGSSDASRERQTALRHLERRYEAFLRRLDDDRKEYVQSFAQEIQNPNLRELFYRLLPSSSNNWRDLFQDIQTQFTHPSSPQEIGRHVDQFNQIIRLADDPASASAEERNQFRQVIMRYLQDRAHGGYERAMPQRLSGYQSLVDEIERMLEPDRDPEGGKD